MAQRTTQKAQVLSWKDEKALVDKRRNLKEVSPEKEKTGSRTQLDLLLSDWCAICHDGGDTLYCCDRCPKVYHMNCYVPPLPGEPQRCTSARSKTPRAKKQAESQANSEAKSQAQERGMSNVWFRRCAKYKKLPRVKTQGKRRAQ